MGCDIHMHIEFFDSDSGWQHWDRVNLGRCYPLFGELAGVRDYTVMPIASPRGMPTDASFAVRADYASWAGHSLSYISAGEYISREFDIRYSAAVRELRESLDDLSTVGYTCFRLVFWFDN